MVGLFRLTTNFKTYVFAAIHVFHFTVILILASCIDGLWSYSVASLAIFRVKTVQ